jgi:hypothetical protein
MLFFFLFLITQDIMVESTAALDELIAASYSKTSAEQTAVAALTALRNNNNHTKTVTSVLSKTHLQNLEANSVSVIPIDTKSSTPINNTTSNLNQILNQKQQQHQHQHKQSSSPIHQQQQQQQQQALHAKSMAAQYQQHLETAAVLMDISKKAIISPPSSNPQSPSLAEQLQQPQSQSITSTVIKAQDYNIKRISGNEEIDLSFKRVKLDQQQQQQNHHHHQQQQQQHQQHNNHVITKSPTLNANQTLIKNPVIKKEIIENLDENSQQSDSNVSSDSERLQMDISSQDLSEDHEENKINHHHAHHQNRQHHHQQHNQHNNSDLGRETPDSLTSEGGGGLQHHHDGTDPATTQLWQALAHTTGKFFFC